MYYHIYNRGVNKSTPFHESTNYLFVIEKLQKYCLKNLVTMICECYLQGIGDEE